jgi:hypothetical protein
VTDEAYESRKAAHTLLERRESNDGPKADVLYQGVSRLKWLADNPDWWTATYVTAHIIVDKTVRSTDSFARSSSAAAMLHSRKFRRRTTRI